MKKILVLCTGNSCRSILAEALLNYYGKDRLMAFSAGSHPTGKVNPNALAILTDHGIPAEGYFSKSWDDLSEHSFDIVITVCDNAAGETCPVYLDRAIKAHWGLPDPAIVTGTDQNIKAAFSETYNALLIRIRKMLELPLERLSDQQLVLDLNQIGRIDE